MQRSHSNSFSLSLLLLSIGALLLLAAPTRAQEPVQTPPPPSVEERLAALEKKAEGNDSLRVFWKDGLRFESADKRTRLKLGGRLHYDGQFFDPDADTRAALETGNTRIEDGTEIRRLRYELGGELGARLEWAMSVDFGGGSTNLRDAYAGLKDLPVGSLRAGQFKEPYGLEQIESSNTNTFIERSLMNALVPARNAGLMLYDQAAEGRMTWAVGGFRTGTDAGEVSRGDGEWATTARLTGLPLCSADGRKYLHAGLDYSHRSPTNDSYAVASKPEANLAPNYVNATVAAASVDLVGAELALILGPVALSGEYSLASVDSAAGSTSEPDFRGYYVQASTFLTGESRPYRKDRGTFAAVKPRASTLGETFGPGAWEVAARLSSLDLSDDGTDGGALDDLTFGLNWYLDAGTRLMLDYTIADLDPAGAGADGTTGILAFRWQFSF